MKNVLEQLAGLGILVLMLLGLVALLAATSGSHCPAGDTEMWCGMRW